MLGWTVGSNKTGGIRFKNQKTWPRTNPRLIVYPYLAIRAPAALKEENKLFNRYSHFCCVRKSCFMAVLNSSTESPCLTQMRGDVKMNRMIFTFYGTFTCKIPSLWCDSTMERSPFCREHQWWYQRHVLPEHLLLALSWKRAHGYSFHVIHSVW